MFQFVIINVHVNLFYASIVFGYTVQHVYFATKLQEFLPKVLNQLMLVGRKVFVIDIQEWQKIKTWNKTSICSVLLRTGPVPVQTQHNTQTHTILGSFKLQFFPRQKVFEKIADFFYWPSLNLFSVFLKRNIEKCLFNI